MQTAKRAAAVLVALLAVPAATHAQQLGTIAGAVRDTSGAVLPGVTVEVASPALIEKVRTAVADGSGQYTVINLPVGTYSVTFTLPGFNTVKREGIQLPANFTATINAELNVGALEETITVTGESPTVDLRSAGVARSVTPGSHPRHSERRHDVSAGADDGRRQHDEHAGRRRHGGLSKGNQLVSHGGRPGDELQLVDGLRAGNSTSQAGRSGLIFSRCCSTRSTSRCRARPERRRPTASSATASTVGRQHVQRHDLRERVRVRAAERQPLAAPDRHGPAERAAHQGALRRKRRHRRADHARPRLVLLHGAETAQRQLLRRRLLSHRPGRLDSRG